MTTNDFNLPTWCHLRAERFRDFEQHEMAMYPDSDNRDTAIVEWTIRCLANPEVSDAREALTLIAGQHEDELNPRGTNEWWKGRVKKLTDERDEARKHRDEESALALRLAAALTESRTNAAALANEVGQLTAENARVRQQRDEGLADLTEAGNAVDLLTVANTRFFDQLTEAGKHPCNCCFNDGSTIRCGRASTQIITVMPYGFLAVADTCAERINGKPAEAVAS